MYEIYKDGARLSIEDTLNYTHLQKNGVNVLCDRDKADGVVINNEYIEPLASVKIRRISGADAIRALETLGYKEE